MRQHMSRADRAKQFAPFAALRGYEAALREAERQTPRPVELAEDAQELLDRVLRRRAAGLPDETDEAWLLELAEDWSK